jgi:hypothetical protein
MFLRIGLFVVPAVAAVGLVLLLNGLGAGAGVAVLALGLLAVASGVALGYFADRLPELPTVRRRHNAQSSTRLAGTDGSRR